MCDRLENIEKALQRLERKLDTVDKKCDKVTDHATFVEGVYETIRAPLSFITGYVASYMPSMTDDTQNKTLLPPLTVENGPSKVGK